MTSSQWYAPLKRLIDAVAAGVAIAVLAPVLLAVAAAIAIGDPGPILFRQWRVGAGGRPFLLYKFRSMPVNTGDIASDRLGAVTLSAVGSFIRRTNVDELPQLWNVLKGDMSLVGPRPCLPNQNELIELRRANGALACRPGLTGLAQVNSYDGMSVARKAEFDGQYAARVSLLSDLAVLLRTPGYLLRPPPTY